MNTSKTAKPNSCLRSCFVGGGCGCIYPLFLLLFVLGISYYLFADAQRLIREPISLAVLSPKQEDFWKIKEKRDLIRADSDVSDTVELTPSEFNAFLSSYTFKPYGGYFLDKMRFLPAKNKGTFYLIGSGMFLRSLIISIEFSFNKKYKVIGIKLNSWNVPTNSFIFTKVLKYISQFFKENNYNISYFTKFLRFIKIESDSIIIPKSIMLFKKSYEK